MRRAKHLLPLFLLACGGGPGPAEEAVSEPDVEEATASPGCLRLLDASVQKMITRAVNTPTKANVDRLAARVSQVRAECEDLEILPQEALKALLVGFQAALAGWYVSPSRFPGLSSKHIGDSAVGVSDTGVGHWAHWYLWCDDELGRLFALHEAEFPHVLIRVDARSAALRGALDGEGPQELLQAALPGFGVALTEEGAAWKAAGAEGYTPALREGGPPVAKEALKRHPRLEQIGDRVSQACQRTAEVRAKPAGLARSAFRSHVGLPMNDYIGGMAEEIELGALDHKMDWPFPVDRGPRGREEEEAERDTPLVSVPEAEGSQGRAADLLEVADDLKAYGFQVCAWMMMRSAQADWKQTLADVGSTDWNKGGVKRQHKALKEAYEQTVSAATRARNIGRLLARALPATPEDASEPAEESVAEETRLEARELAEVGLCLMGGALLDAPPLQCKAPEEPFLRLAGLPGCVGAALGDEVSRTHEADWRRGLAAGVRTIRANTAWPPEAVKGAQRALALARRPQLSDRPLPVTRCQLARFADARTLRALEAGPDLYSDLIALAARGDIPLLAAQAGPLLLAGYERVRHEARRSCERPVTSTGCRSRALEAAGSRATLEQRQAYCQRMEAGHDLDQLVRGKAAKAAEEAPQEPRLARRGLLLGQRWQRRAQTFHAEAIAALSQVDREALEGLSNLFADEARACRESPPVAPETPERSAHRQSGREGAGPRQPPAN